MEGGGEDDDGDGEADDVDDSAEGTEDNREDAEDVEGAEVVVECTPSIVTAVATPAVAFACSLSMRRAASLPARRACSMRETRRHMDAKR